MNLTRIKKIRKIIIKHHGSTLAPAVEIDRFYENYYKSKVPKGEVIPKSLKEKREFMKLPIKKRQKILAKQVEKFLTNSRIQEGVMKKVITGKVWSGYIGEDRKPPVFIIVTPGVEGNTVFVSALFKKFMAKKVRITIQEL